jgi:hypothetical protein
MTAKLTTEHAFVALRHHQREGFAKNVSISLAMICHDRFRWCYHAAGAMAQGVQAAN